MMQLCTLVVKTAQQYVHRAFEFFGLEHHVFQLVWIDIAECVWKQLIHHPLTCLLSCLAVFGFVVEVALCRRVMRHDGGQHAHLRLGRP